MEDVATSQLIFLELESTLWMRHFSSWGEASKAISYCALLQNLLFPKVNKIIEYVAINQIGTITRIEYLIPAQFYPLCLVTLAAHKSFAYRPLQRFRVFGMDIKILGGGGIDIFSPKINTSLVKAIMAANFTTKIYYWHSKWNIL